MRCLWLIRQKVFKRLLRVPGWKRRSGRQELSCGKWTMGVDEMGPKCGRDREHKGEKPRPRQPVQRGRDREPSREKKQGTQDHTPRHTAGRTRRVRFPRRRAIKAVTHDREVG